jgi:hypothetical protein
MPLAAIDVSDGLVQILIRLYGEQRAEDLSCNGCIGDGIEPHRIPLTSKNSPSIFRTAAINVLSETKHNVFNCR